MQTFQKFFGIILLSLVIFSACQENPSDPASANSDQMSLSKGRIIHHVSVGSCDIVPPGQDRNFSLVANMDAEGNVSGQWQDVFGGGAGSIHVAIDCLEMVGSNAAIVGGVITHGTLNGVDVSGQRAVTAVMDNGQGSNSDPDQVSFSYFPVNGTCGNYTLVQLGLFDIQCGQVKVINHE